jgi:hypothetical protein
VAAQWTGKRLDYETGRSSVLENAFRNHSAPLDFSKGAIESYDRVTGTVRDY